ncbi:unnamed protein product [Phytophthora lilii]|uniref:Unnamed protein product n=1 Tax=Phytophthora lilii TaxID=2077276 RepID=A0A9W6TXD5_9STRA|nr:unnamed protein product [Phytophthora lilii]
MCRHFVNLDSNNCDECIDEIYEHSEHLVDADAIDIYDDMSVVQIDSDSDFDPEDDDDCLIPQRRGFLNYPKSIITPLHLNERYERVAQLRTINSKIDLYSRFKACLLYSIELNGCSRRRSKAIHSG